MDRRIILVNRTGICGGSEGDFVMYVDNSFPVCLETNVVDWVFTNLGMDFNEYGSYNDGQTNYVLGVVSSRNKKWPDYGFREVQWRRVKNLNPDSNKYSGIIKYLKDSFS